MIEIKIFNLKMPIGLHASLKEHLKDKHHNGLKATMTQYINFLISRDIKYRDPNSVESSKEK